jgi:uncharacterized protein with FMN-binding domain
MTKNRLLASVGFTLGAAIVLISWPPTLFTPPDTYQRPIEPTSNPTSEEIISTPSASLAPQVVPSTSPTTHTTVIPITPTPVTSVKPIVTTQTINGDIFAASKYGNVQVQIVVTNGVITATKALVYPNADSRSSSLSAIAIPILIEQTLIARDNSNIQGTSQASYTTDAWIASLQSALDKVK